MSVGKIFFRYASLVLLSPFRTIMAFVAAAVAGYALIPKLGLDLQPYSSPPALTVTYQLPGASPEALEQEATSRLENGLSQIAGIKRLYSISHYDLGTIEITFDKSEDLAFKRFEVASVIRMLYPKLNPRVTYPVIEQRTRETESKRALLIYRINADLTPFEIHQTASDLFVGPLSRLPGVGEVRVSGAQGLRILIEYDPARLHQFGIQPSALAEAVSRFSSEEHLGLAVYPSGQRVPVKSLQAIDPGSLGALLIRADSSYLPLRSLARTSLQESEPQQYTRINGRNAITIAVYTDKDVNRLRVADAVREEMNNKGSQEQPHKKPILH